MDRSFVEPRRRARRTALATLAAILSLSLEVPARADDAASVPRYSIAATLDTDAGVIRGRVAIAFGNTGRDTMRQAYLRLYPNRFLQDGDEVNDITRMHVYPENEFVAGGLSVDTVAASDGTQLASRIIRREGAPAETVLEVDLGAPLEAGATTTVVLDFTTSLPERFGPFGRTELGDSAVAGWYPYLVPRASDGSWLWTAGPARADVSASLTSSPEVTLVAGSDVFPAPHAPTVQVESRRVATFALIALPGASVTTEEIDGTTITFVAPRKLRERRLAPGPAAPELFRDAVKRAIGLRPATLPSPPTLTVAQVPLRWNLATPSDGIVVVSDRALRVHELLRPFHEAQVAQAVYAELLRSLMRACPEQQPRWISDGVAWALADRYQGAVSPEHPSVHDWIDWFDVFAIVDRFETAPKVPFVQALFRNARSDDDLRENVFDYSGDRPPARLVFARLDRSVGAAELARAVDAQIASPCAPFTTALRAATGATQDAADRDLDAALAPSPAEDVPVLVDPSLRPARERSRYQLVLDTADVEVSSTEFGLAALFVARERGDYTRDLAINPYLTERGYGVNAGPRVHFGPRSDANTYRHNLHAFYDHAWLDRGFRDDSQPEVRDGGQIGGFGLRYDYSNVYFFDNPTEKREARVFVDWYDPDLGGDYGFVRFGGRITATTPILTPRTIAAGEITVGFEEPTDGRGVPTQAQFSLGGRRALRGVSVNEKLARNIGLARAEIRQDVFPEVDFNLLDLLVYRRPQLQLFVDTGQVDDSAGRAVNPGRFAIAAGTGINVLYDFMGFFPGRAYIEVATRLDRDQTDFQVLLGTRQAF
ncbi:MAG: hypothetical protein FJ148_00435 [Deltaproteobacteria bacterium]|nr:hypothetical protein [Deltaproteobacteria bacterium]